MISTSAVRSTRAYPPEGYGNPASGPMRATTRQARSSGTGPGRRQRPQEGGTDPCLAGLQRHCSSSSRRRLALASSAYALDIADADAARRDGRRPVQVHVLALARQRQRRGELEHLVRRASAGAGAVVERPHGTRLRHADAGRGFPLLRRWCATHPAHGSAARRRSSRSRSSRPSRSRQVRPAGRQRGVRRTATSSRRPAAPRQSWSIAAGTLPARDAAHARGRDRRHADAVRPCSQFTVQGERRLLAPPSKQFMLKVTEPMLLTAPRPRRSSSAVSSSSRSGSRAAWARTRGRGVDLPAGVGVNPTTGPGGWPTQGSAGQLAYHGHGHRLARRDRDRRTRR